MLNICYDRGKTILKRTGFKTERDWLQWIVGMGLENWEEWKRIRRSWKDKIMDLKNSERLGQFQKSERNLDGFTKWEKLGMDSKIGKRLE